MQYSEFLGKKYLLIILGAFGIYSLFLFFSDIENVYDKLVNLNLVFIPLILLVVFSSWMILFIRWFVLLKKNQINIPIKLNLAIFFAGFTLAISPAKSGELIKSVLLKNKCNIKRTETVPIVFLERFYDIIGTAIVAAIGITFLGFEFSFVLAFVAIVIIIIFYATYSKKSVGLTLNIIGRIKFLKKYSSNLEESQKIIKKSSNIQTVGICSVLTILFRFVEAIGVGLVLLSLGINFIDFFQLASTYSASIILGTISMSPGGLGVTEGSLAGLLTLQGIELKTTIILAIIIRFFTLWFGIIVGFVSLKLIDVIKYSKQNSEI